jgi:hypothetical protein
LDASGTSDEDGEDGSAGFTFESASRSGTEDEGTWGAAGGTDGGAESGFEGFVSDVESAADRQRFQRSRTFFPITVPKAKLAATTIRNSIVGASRRDFAGARADDSSAARAACK